MPARARKSGLADRIAAESKSIDALHADLQRLDAAQRRANEATRATAALTALTAGKPLGAIQGAPPAVARYASTAPPTLADLRRSFQAAAEDALRTSRPNDADTGLANRVWNRAQSLVTVRQGDNVLVGDPAAGVIAHAREDLDAGDLAGAVDALGKLSTPGPAMSDWLASARSVLAARTALVGMAGQS